MIRHIYQVGRQNKLIIHSECSFMLQTFVSLLGNSVEEAHDSMHGIQSTNSSGHRNQEDEGTDLLLCLWLDVSLT